MEEVGKGTPAGLILARFRAFAEGDFGFIYDSTHADSFFRRQFPEREAYLHYGRETLAADFRIRDCRILKEKVGEGEARLLVYLDALFRGERTEMFELALLLRTPEGWRYHSAQKLTREEYPGPVEEIDWEDFERAQEKTIF